MHSKRNRRSQETKRIYIFLEGTKFWNEGESLSYADDFRREYHQLSYQSESVRDPDPDDEARQDFWTLWEMTCIESWSLETKICVYGRSFETSELHWYPETNANTYWSTTRDNHRLLLEYYWRQVTVSKPCIETTRFELLDTTSSKGLMWVQSRLPRKQVSSRSANLVRGMVKHVEKLSV